MGEHRVIPADSALRKAKSLDYHERKKIEGPDTRTFKARQVAARKVLVAAAKRLAALGLLKPPA